MPSTNRPEYAVRIEDGPGCWITETGVGPLYLVRVTTTGRDYVRVTCYETQTRMAAWACALAALKGELRLERSRH